VNRKETVLLTRMVAAACPQQAIDDYTPDAWFELLGDLAFDDCRAATKTITQRQPFIAPSEIRAEVRRIRSDRIARSVIPAPPAELADDPQAYRQALVAATKLAADGHALPAPAEVQAITGGGRSGSSGPTSLRQALAGVRRALGPGRAPRPALGDERQMARDQVAEMRAAREKDEGSESA
jgi:hypothetical protein